MKHTGASVQLWNGCRNGAGAVWAAGYRLARLESVNESEVLLFETHLEALIGSATHLYTSVHKMVSLPFSLF